MPRPISYAVFCLKKKKSAIGGADQRAELRNRAHHWPPYSSNDSYMFQIYYFFHSFFFNDTATTEIYTLSLHDALPILTVFSFSKNHFSSPSGRWSIVLLISSWGSTL